MITERYTILRDLLGETVELTIEYRLIPGRHGDGESPDDFDNVAVEAAWVQRLNTIETIQDGTRHVSVEYVGDPCPVPDWMLEMVAKSDDLAADILEDAEGVW